VIISRLRVPGEHTAEARLVIEWPEIPRPAAPPIEPESAAKAII
jgi:hypothetical protein